MAHEIVEWLDHYGNHGSKSWKTRGEIIEDCDKDFIVETHGQVLHENRTRLIIASDVRLDEDLAAPLYQNYTVIYKKLIRNRRAV